MNTNRLKRFAQEARVKLLDQVNSRLELVLNTDSAELREKATSVQQLKEAIKSSSKEQVVDKVAYTWFNRLMALRFMDVNEYQPLKLKVLTPKEGFTLPEILEDTNKGQIPDELPVNKQRINDLLDGKIPSTNAQNEIYKELLIAACNHLHSVFPFLFEKINDYTELLLPNDLTSEFSIINDFVEGMQEEDCKEVEVIGWLYQFYISEKKDELINAKKRYKADEIAPVTQLFTPKWIVQYMVDNTLGQFWKEVKPHTGLTAELEFYIKPHSTDSLPIRSTPVEEITFFDPCVGSGHILAYAFDLFYKMYEEEGYNPSEIPELILAKNLFGIDIDDRAAQLAAFTLMMKGRQYHKRFLRKSVIPNVTSFKNIESDGKFKNAKVLGSLIKISKGEVDSIVVEENSLFSEEQRQHRKQAQLLANKYDVVVTNPPYLNASYMEGTLKQYVEKEYPQTKSDLFACFFVQASNFANKEGLVGFICPYVWMFIKSYEWLRRFSIDSKTIASLIQLEYNAFGPAVVPICTFTFRNRRIKDYKGSYIKLSNFRGVDNQRPKTLEAIKNPNCGWFFINDQTNFNKIDGSPISFWASEKILKIFDEGVLIKKISKAGFGIKTGNNDVFFRKWFEVEIGRTSLDNSKNSKWVPCASGGKFRKWYGNREILVNYKGEGKEIVDYAKKNGNSYGFNSKDLYFKNLITWPKLTSSNNSFRYTPADSIFDGVGLSANFKNQEDLYYCLGFLNTKLVQKLLNMIAPGMSLTVGEFYKLPVLKSEAVQLDLIKDNILLAKSEWDSKEGSWDFRKNELIRFRGEDLKEILNNYLEYWKNSFFQLHKNEEQINKQFIKTFALQDEITSDVLLEEITFLKEEADIINGELVFDQKEIFAQFISYAVGCMFGRYSLDKEGLILANPGETLQDYLEKLQRSNSKFQRLEDLTLVPDEDNIIPVLDEEWFEDDIVGRFYEFLKASFGKENFDKNLAFVEECLGKDVRRYFVRDFYKDHIKRYKKRPIYWMFSSPKGSFSVLIYLHRYTPDTLNNILNGYLLEYKEKIKARMEHLDHIIETGSSTEQTRAGKEKDKLKLVLIELDDYEREVLYPLATKRIAIDLDDGVLVNYNKFGKAVEEVKGLNDKKAKKKVRGFDWIDTDAII